jgi:hypothetical protein
MNIDTMDQSAQGREAISHSVAHDRPMQPDGTPRNEKWPTQIGVFRVRSGPRFTFLSDVRNDECRDRLGG